MSVNLQASIDRPGRSIDSRSGGAAASSRPQDSGRVRPKLVESGIRAAGVGSARRAVGRRPACLLALLGVALMACSKPAPPPTADPLVEYGPYLEALKRGDVEAALERSWRPRRARQRKEAEARLSEAVRFLADGTLRIDALEARTDGNWALVVLRLTQRAPGGEVRVLREEMMLGVDGRWLVVARSRLEDEELRRQRDESLTRLLTWFRASDEQLSDRWLRTPDSSQEP